VTSGSAEWSARQELNFTYPLTSTASHRRA